MGAKEETGDSDAVSGGIKGVAVCVWDGEKGGDAVVCGDDVCVRKRGGIGVCEGEWWCLCVGARGDDGVWGEVSDGVWGRVMIHTATRVCKSRCLQSP